jgi:predicted  nucleic acid-binding Zn-ribbon protein
LINALRIKDSPRAQVAYESFVRESKPLRARAVEYEEKALDPLIKSKLHGLIKRYDQGQKEISGLAPKLIKDPSSTADINNLEVILEENDLIIAQIADNDDKSSKTLARLKDDISKAGERFAQAAIDGNVVSAADFLDAYKREARNFKQNAQSICSAVSDPLVKAELFASLDNLEALELRLFDFIESENILTDETDEEERTSKIVEILHVADKSRDKLDSEINMALAAEISYLLSQLADHRRPETTLGAVHSTAEKGDQKAIPSTINDFQNRSGNLSDLLVTLERMMVETGETQLASKTKLLVQRLKMLEPSTIAAYEALAFSPKDAGASEFSKGMTAIWEENIRDITNLILGEEGVFTATEIAEGLSMSFLPNIFRKIIRSQCCNLAPVLQGYEHRRGTSCIQECRRVWKVLLGFCSQRNGKHDR